MILSSLTFHEARTRLKSNGLYFKTGPFTIHFNTHIENITKNFYKLYSENQIFEQEVFSDFHIKIDLPNNFRRWVRPQVFFYLDNEIPFKPLPFNQAYPMLEWGMNWCIANHSHQYLIIHAAVLEKNNKAIILPAEPGSGKSTLAAILTLNGWRLLSDELALISLKDLSAIPLSRPINLKNDSIDIIKSMSETCIFSDVYDDTNKGSVALLKTSNESVSRADEVAIPCFIIKPKYINESKASLARVSPGKMFMHVAENSFNYSVLGKEGFEVLSNLIDLCGCFDFIYGNNTEAVNIMNSLVANN